MVNHVSLHSGIIFLQSERRQQLRDRVKDWDAKKLKRSLGIMHFIGELFKLKMLSEIVIHECLVRLLQSSSDTDCLECFARLLTISGKDVDKPEAKVCKYIKTILFVDIFGRPIY